MTSNLVFSHFRERRKPNPQYARTNKITIGIRPHMTETCAAAIVSYRNCGTHAVNSPRATGSAGVAAEREFNCRRWRKADAAGWHKSEPKPEWLTAYRVARVTWFTTSFQYSTWESVSTYIQRASVRALVLDKLTTIS